MALDRSKRPPRSGHGRPPFWERPSLALPDPWEPRRGCANYAPLGGAVNANGDRGSSVAPGPVALVLRPGWLQTAARSPLLLQCLVLGGWLRRHHVDQRLGPSWIRAITDHLRVNLHRHYAASYALKGDRPRSPKVRQALWAVNANGKGDHLMIAPASMLWKICFLSQLISLSFCWGIHMLRAGCFVIRESCSA
jgi:hypothetical protein